MKAFHGKQELRKTANTLGIRVQIYTNPMFKGCSNGGISDNFTGAILVGEGIPELSGGHELPRLKLNKGYIIGHVFAEPLEAQTHQYMAGGAFVYSSDGRFNEAVQAAGGANGSGAISLHDREEL